MTEEAFVAVEKVATHFGVKVHTIRAWVRQGHIPRTAYIKVGNTYRFSISRVEQALTSGSMESPEPETPDAVGEVPPKNAPVQLELDFDTDKDV